MINAILLRTFKQQHDGTVRQYQYEASTTATNMVPALEQTVVASTNE
jgi:hypothetical protein